MKIRLQFTQVLTIILFALILSFFSLGSQAKPDSDHFVEPKNFPKQSAQIYYTGLVPAIMNFEREGIHYTITTKMNIPFKGPFVFISKGTIENGQFKPTEFTDMRKNKPYTFVQFNYENKTITYGKVGEEPKTVPMEENPQDLFSLTWQLAIDKGQTATPLQVVTGKSIKHYSPEQFLITKGRYQAPTEILSVIKIDLPESNRPISYSLASDFGYLPAVIVYDGFELYVERALIDGKVLFSVKNKR